MKKWRKLYKRGISILMTVICAGNLAIFPSFAVEEQGETAEIYEENEGKNREFEGVLGEKTGLLEAENGSGESLPEDIAEEEENTPSMEWQLSPEGWLGTRIDDVGLWYGALSDTMVGTVSGEFSAEDFPENDEPTMTIDGNAGEIARSGLPDFALAPVGELTYGDEPFSFTVLGLPQLAIRPVTFSSSDQGILAFDGTMATILSAGTVTVTATYPGDALYRPAATAVSVTISPAQLLVVADDVDGVTVGETLPTLTYQTTGLVNGDTFTEPVLTTSAADTDTPGVYEISVSGGVVSNGGYEITYVSGSLTIEEPVLAAAAGEGGNSAAESALPPAIVPQDKVYYIISPNSGKETEDSSESDESRVYGAWARPMDVLPLEVLPVVTPVESAVQDNNDGEMESSAPRTTTASAGARSGSTVSRHTWNSVMTAAALVLGFWLFLLLGGKHKKEDEDGEFHHHRY